MFNWLARRKMKAPIYAAPGDTIEATYESCSGRKETASSVITQDLRIDEITIFEFKEEFDCKRGVGAFFGEKE